MNNLLQQRFRQMQGMNQMQPNADAQWYDTMSNIGSAVFGNMAGATKDGEYQGQKMKEMEGYDAKLSDKENYQKLFPQNSVGAANQSVNNYSIDNSDAGPLSQAFNIGDAISSGMYGTNIGNFFNGIDTNKLGIVGDPDKLAKLRAMTMIGG